MCSLPPSLLVLLYFTVYSEEVRASLLLARCVCVRVCGGGGGRAFGKIIKHDVQYDKVSFTSIPLYVPKSTSLSTLIRRKETTVDSFQGGTLLIFYQRTGRN